MSAKRDDSLNAALDALKRAERVKRDVEAVRQSGPAEAEETAQSSSWFGRWPSGFGRRTAGNVIGALDVVWNGWLRPLARFLKPLTQRVWRFYRWSYRKFAHVKAEDGAPRFSRNRAAIVTLALAVITVATPVIFVRSVIPFASRTVYDTAMLFTMREDRLFLGRAELINPDRPLFQVLGCRDIAGCDGGDNTIYFRLRDNVILDIKYWTTRFEPYDPAEIAGAMVSELNDCTITYYGRRSKALGWYPYIMNASCVPL